jgi:hypothetical protein
MLFSVKATKNKNCSTKRRSALHSEALATLSERDGGFWHRQISDGVIKIIIPTLNSANYIALVLSYYREIGMPVTVFVDSKTSDNTALIAACHAHEVVPFVNPATRVGEMIEGISRHCGTRWVLRMDDDELPSIRMLEFVRYVISQDECKVVGFDRYQTVFNSNGDPFCSIKHDPITHRQWRLYQPDEVTFHGRGHTPGFDFTEAQRLVAPSTAFMIHLDWVVHSREERLKKLARYDAHTAGHGMPFRNYYLADESPDFHTDLQTLPGPEFRRVGKHMVDRFSASAF